MAAPRPEHAHASARPASGVEHVAAVAEVTQVGLGGAYGPEILKHVTQFSTTSFNTVTVFEPAYVITGYPMGIYLWAGYCFCKNK
jgi:hypothetical protein